MNGEKLTAHPLVTDEQAEFEKKHQLKFRTSGGLPIILEEFTSIPPLNKVNPKDVSM